MPNQEKYKNIAIVAIIIIMAGIIFSYQTKKVGFHEDEIFTITSSVNPYDGLMSPYRDKDVNTILCEKYVFDDDVFTEIRKAIDYVLNQNMYEDERNALINAEVPIWKTREDVTSYVTLAKENSFNLKAIYFNQLKDTHPPFFYTLVHFSSLIFGGQFTKYSVFVVNIIAFILSCFVIKKILEILDKENLIFATLIFYGLSMGTISMVIYQRMYTVLTLFILLYFYYSIKVYKNGYYATTELKLKLGIVTVLGFLTQYYFAIYAVSILAIMVIKMIKDKEYKDIAKYIVLHIIYAIIGILIFVPSVYHLIFNDRGISNLANTEYYKHFIEYIKFLLYAFTIEDDNWLVIGIMMAFIIGLVYAIKKSKQKFILVLTFLPSLIYFLLVVKLTSYRELRYIMPMIPFVVLTVIFILDKVLNFKYKDIAIVAIAIAFVATGFMYSKPKFLYEEYEQCLEIAKENKYKSFIYVYDNMFNHIQSIPEMMIYKRTMIINVNRNELQYCINNDELNKENSYILSIKTYMDNEAIIKEILKNTDFNNVTKLYEGGNSSEIISNNLYLVSK